MDQKLKLEKLKLQYDQDRLIADQVDSLLRNPLIEYMLGIMFIAYVTRGNQSVLERLTGVDLMAGGYGMGLTAIISAQQLSAALPYLTQMSKEAAPILAGMKLLK